MRHGWSGFRLSCMCFMSGCFGFLTPGNWNLTKRLDQQNTIIISVVELHMSTNFQVSLRNPLFFHYVSPSCFIIFLMVFIWFSPHFHPFFLHFSRVQPPPVSAGAAKTAPGGGRLGPGGGPQALVEQIQPDAGHFVLAAAGF